MPRPAHFLQGFQTKSPEQAQSKQKNKPRAKREELSNFPYWGIAILPRVKPEKVARALPEKSNKITKSQFGGGVGVKYNINKKIKIEFDPFDDSFARRFSDTVCEIQKLYTEYETGKSQLIKNTNPVKLGELRISSDLHICSLIDGLFDAPVSDAVFPGDSLSITTDTHIPCWLVLMSAIAKYIKSPLSGACKKIIEG